MSRAIDLGEARRPRRPSLTPLIDVVFLLLVFFMLASRFGGESALALGAGGGAERWSGPPRLVEDMGDPVILRVGADADVQALATVLSRLEAAGFRHLVVME